MGLYSFGEIGTHTLCIGLMMARFQRSGKILFSNEKLMMCVRTEAILLIKEFITKMLILSTPTDIDLILLATLITSGSVTS